MSGWQPAEDLNHRDVAAHKQLLVGYDQHSASQQALLVAAQLAQALDAHLTVIHVVDLEDYPIDPDRADWEEAAEKQVVLQEGHATQLLEEAPITWTYQTLRGDPALTLAKAGSDLDAMFIVVGATGRNLVSRLTHGSVPQDLFRHQPKPVLVVPDIPKVRGM